MVPFFVRSETFTPPSSVHAKPRSVTADKARERVKALACGR
jgi:hypothetical protein